MHFEINLNILNHIFFSSCLTNPNFNSLKTQWGYFLTQTDIKIESVTEHAGRTLSACRDTLSMWNKFSSTLCLSHYSFSFWGEHSNFSYPSKRETETQYFYTILAVDTMSPLIISQKSCVRALFFCAFAAWACWGLTMLADRPEAVSEGKLIQDAPPSPQCQDMRE